MKFTNMKLSLQLENETFQLAQPSDSYLEGVEALLNDPFVAEWLGGCRSRASIADAIEREGAHWREHGFGPWLLIGQNHARVIGRGGIRYADILGKREVELFYAIRPSYWGKGLGSFIVRSALRLAFEQAALPSVIVFTMPTNKASLCLIDKFHFSKEGEFDHAGLPHILFRLNRAAWMASAK